jgi:hypothetical protein
MEVVMLWVLVACWNETDGRMYSLTGRFSNRYIYFSVQTILR